MCYLNLKPKQQPFSCIRINNYYFSDKGSHLNFSSDLYKLNRQLMSKEWNNMPCNYSDYVFEKGFAEGYAEGKVEMIIAILKDAGASEEAIVKEIIEHLNVPYDEAITLRNKFKNIVE